MINFIIGSWLLAYPVCRLYPAIERAYRRYARRLYAHHLTVSSFPDDRFHDDSCGCPGFIIPAPAPHKKKPADAGRPLSFSKSAG
jgi:hypothetical protein